jgi:anti-sigma regulatory factor (Ser/Thr protein kinase)
MEHGNKYQADLPVEVTVMSSARQVAVRIRDAGGGAPLPAEAQTPDLEAKLSEEQTPRGWGLFLIRNLVDEMRVTSDENHHTVELIMSREEEDDDAN